MSLAVVNKVTDRIKAAGFATDDNIAELIRAAERSKKGKSDGVSNAEARAVNDFFLQVKAGKIEMRGPKGMSMLNAFFVAHSLPYGDNTKPMAHMIASFIVGSVQGPLPVMEKPPRTGSLQPMLLPDKRIGYLDIVKNEFVVRDGEQFLGPVQLPEAKPQP